jgi:pimeloyl-ACP methyl ester carboxylesterase
MSESEQLILPDGRSVGYHDFGPRSGERQPVLWCHGAPGCRFEPTDIVEAASAAGFRIIAIDRPGYGLSTPQPGRTIAGWPSDALAVAAALGLEKFATVGVSTGGAYALALASQAPARVTAALLCCAMTDMNFVEARVTMNVPYIGGIWTAADRPAALALARARFGDDGSTFFARSPDEPALPASDLALFSRPEVLNGLLASFKHVFAHGVQGYTDDRIADGKGWSELDLSAITCPVLVLHGRDDVVVRPVHAEHTAAIVPGAQLCLVDGRGHFSISDQLVPALARLCKPV